MDLRGLARSAEFFGTRGLDKVRGTVDGTHKLPVTAQVRRTTGKSAGDPVEVQLLERLSRTSTTAP